VPADHDILHNLLSTSLSELRVEMQAINHELGAVVETVRIETRIAGEQRIVLHAAVADLKKDVGQNARTLKGYSDAVNFRVKLGRLGVAFALGLALVVGLWDDVVTITSRTAALVERLFGQSGPPPPGT